MTFTSDASFWSHFIAWLTGAYTEEWWQGPGWAVALPLLACALLVLRRPAMLRDASFWAAVAACSLACGLTAYWKEQPELDTVSLHMAPLMLFVIAVCAWRGRVPRADEAYVGSYLSLLGPDVAHAVLRFGPEHEGWGFLQGVGGAGLGDGLFMYPVLGALLVFYANWRQGHRQTAYKY